MSGKEDKHPQKNLNHDVYAKTFCFFNLPVQLRN